MCVPRETSKELERRAKLVSTLVLRAVLVLGRLAVMERGNARLTHDERLTMLDDLFEVLELLNDEHFVDGEGWRKGGA